MEDSESVFQLGLQDGATVDETTDFRFVIPAFTATRKAPDGDSIGFALRASRKKEKAVTAVEEYGGSVDEAPNIVDFALDGDLFDVSDGENNGAVWLPYYGPDRTESDGREAVTASFGACEDPCCCFQ